MYKLDAVQEALVPSAAAVEGVLMEKQMCLPSLVESRHLARTCEEGQGRMQTFIGTSCWIADDFCTVAGLRTRTVERNQSKIQTLYWRRAIEESNKCYFGASQC